MPRHDGKAASRPPPDGRGLVEPLAVALLDAPLDYIFADHVRHRVICAALQNFAARKSATRADADRVMAFLTQELRLHHEDEDLDLYPALRRRALPADDLGVVLARLGEDHRQGDAMVDAIVRVLGARPAADPVRIDPQAGEMMQVYASREQRHLALENAVVLSIARIRLTRADIRGISRGMKARRGVTLP